MKYKINISIDDISPHPRSSTEVLNRCHELIDIFPNIKFSLFIPMAYWRTARPGTTTEKPLIVSAYPEFCEILKNLPKENFELGYHGFFHGKPQEKNDNNELYRISYDKATEVIKNMYNVAEHSGLKDIFKPILRPPTWNMSPNSFDAANDMGIKLFALTETKNSLKSYEGYDKKYKSVYSNYAPPNRELKMTEKCGIVYHACEWLKNYLDHKKTEELIETFKKHENDIEFCFLESFLG